MRQEERKERSKEKILQAALEEFATNGYEAVNIEGICTRHHISKGMMYHYFTSKDDLLLACIRSTFEALEDKIKNESVSIKDGPVLERIRDYLMIREYYFIDHPLQKKIFEIAIIKTPTTLTKTISELHQPLKRLNHEFISKEIKRSKLRSDVTQDQIMRYLEVIDRFLSDIVRSYSTEISDIDRLFQSTEEVLDLILYGILS